MMEHSIMRVVQIRKVFDIMCTCVMYVCNLIVLRSLQMYIYFSKVKYAKFEILK